MSTADGKSQPKQRSKAATGPLPQEEYDAIYSTVPRLSVEVVISSKGRVLLSKRRTGPCKGLWHIPGGTVRYGEPLRKAVSRVAREELGAPVEAGRLLGYIEYPSHLSRGIDWPVGIAFEGMVDPSSAPREQPGSVQWFGALPATMHEEQAGFLLSAGLGLQPAPAPEAGRNDGSESRTEERQA